MGGRLEGHGVVVICTRGRPGDVARALAAVAEDRPAATVVVVDASDDEKTEAVCSSLAREHPGLDLHWLRADRPGLARQRNQAIAYCDELGAGIVHFIDDDTIICPGYLETVEGRFAGEADLDGVGAMVDNQPPVHFRWLRFCFMLWGPYPNTVLRSGRPVIGQFPSDRSGRRVDWLSGCAMSYRMSLLRRQRFDDRLSGYSHGEDFDFGFRASRAHRLAVEPSAHCLHNVSPTNRTDPRRLAYVSTVSGYVWAREQRGNGISVACWWWSVLGEALLHGAYGVLKGTSSDRRRCLGIADGVGTILAGRASRDPR